MSPGEFWEMRPTDYNRKVNGYWRNNQRHFWEPMREIAAMVYNSSVSKKSHQRKPTELYPLPLIDKLKVREPVKIKKWTKEEIENLKKIHGFPIKKPSLN